MTEADELIARLYGRAMHLRKRGEVKSPDLMESAAKALHAASPSRSEGVSQHAVRSGGAVAWRVRYCGQLMYFEDQKVANFYAEGGDDPTPLYLAAAQASPKLTVEEMDALESLARCMGFGRSFRALSRALEVIKGEAPSVPSAESKTT